MGQSKIDHEGIIEQIEGDVAHVRIRNGSACSTCHARGGCGAAGQAEKYLDVSLNGEQYSQGETVRVEVTRNLALRAVVLGYILPFLLVLILLTGMLAAGFNELTAGWMSLVALPPYYLVLFLRRKRIESTFTFSLRRM